MGWGKAMQNCKEQVICSYQELLAEGKHRLVDAGIADADLDSFLLLEHVTGMSRSRYFLKAGEPAAQPEAEEYRRLIGQRERHIPLQHITGEQEFMGFPFYVDKHVLVPRQDTESLVELALGYVGGKRVLDMCTGSGCIAVSLMLLGRPVSCCGADISGPALRLARRNAERNRAEVDFLQSDLFEKVTGKYDVIISNPPYIPSDVIEGLSEEVRGHEPYLALDGGEDGLLFYRLITKESVMHLSENGMLFYEIGSEQALDVIAIMEENGFRDVCCRKDYAGNDRIVYGRL